jgi:hypothetical protein
MDTILKNWIESSGDGENTERLFQVIMDELSLGAEVDPKRIKNRLSDLGFQYTPDTFKPHDVLTTRTGNCQGLTFLIGSVFERLGMSFDFVYVTRPIDTVERMELDFLGELEHKLDYANPEFAIEDDQFPLYRCVPSEHLALLVNGKILETTSEDGELNDWETLQKISILEATGCLLKDRSLLAYREERFDESRGLITRSLRRWEDYRGAHVLRATLAMDFFDDVQYQDTVRKILEINGSDSRFFLDKFTFTGDSTALERHLTMYPSSATGTALKAISLVEEDSKESRYLMAVASHLFAGSMLHRLSQFYLANSSFLRGQVDDKIIIEVIEKDRDLLFGQFDYHRGLYELTRDETHLAEAQEAAQTPLQRLTLAYLQGDSKEISSFEREFLGSSLFRDTSKALNRRYNSP